MGGRYMSDGTSDLAIFAVTDKASITISGPVDELDFEGDDDTYVRPRVREGAPERQAATKSGNLYFQNSGERVLDVVIVRQTITEERDGAVEHPKRGRARACRPQPRSRSATAVPLTSPRRSPRKARSAAFAVSSIARRYDAAAPAASPRRRSRSARVAGR